MAKRTAKEAGHDTPDHPSTPHTRETATTGTPQRMTRQAAGSAKPTPSSKSQQRNARGTDRSASPTQHVGRAHGDENDSDDNADDDMSIDAADKGDGSTVSSDQKQAIRADDALAPVPSRLLAMTKALASQNSIVNASLHGLPSDPAVQSVDFEVSDSGDADSGSYQQRSAESNLWRRLARGNQRLGQTVDNTAPVSATSSHSSSVAASADAAVAVETSPFWSAYLQLNTDAFAKDLEQLRQESDMTPSKVRLLVDSLRAGAELWTEQERQLWQASSNPASVSAPKPKPSAATSEPVPMDTTTDSNDSSTAPGADASRREQEPTATKLKQGSAAPATPAKPNVNIAPASTPRSEKRKTNSK
ncbi:hypothetical protein CAOG_00959 [Capsaspora owczarzaki ATCC 30864]|uniref:Ribosome assembly protein 3 n=1 Tax=Capsaspora owczarzaki (strain ATCC 30864) TaxID=595528 RepID=A0A0D2VHT4_CAPO3|nr:hypothetical protein CAOG_00959 [Capsaspora owczarzaki ATCC 30864]KJE89502.1 hypothetical protein CAOG_000959 [Capsaspora owczarzaki ATCC 30864]|eukprot:XP_004365830.1 hypothetical protein CAOG_00959 [Capsaspora owczarzaki ATCC 30864]